MKRGLVLMLLGLSAAAWGDTLPGFRPGVPVTQAEGEEAARMRNAAGDESDCDESRSGVFKAALGDKLLLVSRSHGVAVFDKGGKQLAHGDLDECVGSQSQLDDVLVGRALPSGTQIVVEYVTGGRQQWNRDLVIFDWDGSKLTQLVDVTVEETQDRGETMEETKVRLVSPGKLEIKAGGKKPQIVDLTAPPAAKVASVTATSVYGTGKAKDSYAPWRVLKPSPEYGSAWCEGKADEGLGEGISVAFAEPVVLTKVAVSPGIWKSEKLYQSNNKVTKLTLKLDDGRDFQATAAEKRLEKAVFDFGAATPVKSFKLTITSVTKGTMNDSCITAVELYGADASKPLDVALPGK